MRVWQISESFGLDKLVMTEQPQAVLGPQQVRVRIRACSLNYRDLLVIKGLYNPHALLPLTPVSDGAGEIVEVGGMVSSFKVGDRVCALFSQSWQSGRVDEGAQKTTLGCPLPGVLAEEGIFHEDGLIKFPAHLSFEEASTLPCAGLTAFNALTSEAQLKPGNTVLLEGTGGVSIFALQFATALGVNTIITSRDNDKLARCQELGATHVINYREHALWSKKVLELSQGRGVDAVLEVSGAQTFNQAILALKRGGVMCLIGMLSGGSGPIDLIPILMKQIRIFGVFVGSKTIFESMNRVIEHSGIRPVISKIFDFEEPLGAFKYMESAQHFGKIVIKIN